MYFSGMFNSDFCIFLNSFSLPNQETVRLVYYVYLIYVLALSSNVMGALFYFLFAGGGFGLMFLSIIQLILFTPCAFLLWFRPVYKAFR